MKKFFTLICALVGFAGMANAASVNDLVPLKHSYVLVGDIYTQNGTAKIAKNSLYGDNHFFTPTGHDKATNKGSVDLSVVDETGIVTEDIAAKYGEYGSHLNSLRLKTNQDVFAISVTAKSKVIIFYENNNAVRYPIFAKDASLTEKYSSDADIKATGKIGGKGIGRIEWTATDDGIVYVGAENQIFVSYVIIEANEAPGTPTVKVGDQTFENGLWFREVTCKANDAVEEGVATKTVVTYTTDGTAPKADSPKYTAPIKCYSNMTVKFQAFYDFDAVGNADEIAVGADNEANVNFSFDAPSISADKGVVTFTSPYAEQNGKNYYSVNGGDAVQGDSYTATEGCLVSAYTEITNGTYGKFISVSSQKDIYEGLLAAIKEKKTITVTDGDAIIDEESSEDPKPYIIKDGKISASVADFYVKNLTFGALANADDAKKGYQVPEGQEAYIQMSNTNITFLVAASDSVRVKVTCSKNSCKNLDAADAAADKLDNGCTPDRQCFVNVSGTNYCLTDAEGKHTNDLKLYPEANVFEFGLAGGTEANPKDVYYTFQKYSGTGNILISSIEITPVEGGIVTGISNIATEKASNSAIYNLAGQKVSNDFKGLVIKNGKKFVVK